MNMIQLSKPDIYKIRILNATNTTTQIIVFCKADKSGIKTATDVFSASELQEIEEKKIQVIYSNEQLYIDDNIHTIKKKIVSELGVNKVAYAELYLFCKMPHTVDIEDIQKEFHENADAKAFAQLFKNYGVPLRDDDNSNSLDIFREKKMIRNVPVGTYYGEKTSHVFSANPFDILQTNVGTIGDDQDVILMENNLLLNYHFGRIHENTLYVCLIEDVLKYGMLFNIEEKYMIRTYYPFLYKERIYNLGDWLSRKQQYIKENETYINKNTLLYQKSIDVFYDIYYGRNGHEISYSSRGITSIQFKIKSGYDAYIPLESVFKTIHATKNMPFIKWNPGARRENIYRLYTETRTNDGKFIPFLPENLVMKLSKEIGKQRQIATYIVADSHAFQMSIEQSGNISLSSQFKSPITLDELTEIIKNSINPIIHSLNGYLSQVGYHIPVFESFYEENIEVENINCTLETKLTNELNFGKYIGCISSVFDIIEDNDKTGTHMLFKRIENFREMDAQTRLITDIYKTSNSIDDILNALMQTYKMTEDEANQRVVVYLSEHQDLRGKIVDNHGFPIFMKVSFFEKSLKIDANDILSIAYLDTLFIYLDSMIRLSQYPETVVVAKKDLQGICAKVVKVDKEVLNPQVANVVSTAPIQPIRFAKDKEEEEEEDDDDTKGIFYEDDEEEEELEGGAAGNGSDEESPETYNLNPVGQSLTNPTMFFKRMKQLEPEIFVSQETGDFQGYSRLCLSSAKRQPIILTKEEKMRIDKESPDSYTEALEYGSDPDNPYYYICPRYWCLLTNTSMTEEDVIAGKCAKQGKPDKIIPLNARVVPSDAFVYEFNNPIQHYEKGTGKYHMGYPGFLKVKTPDGRPMPCCFKTPKKNWKYLEEIKKIDEDATDMKKPVKKRTTKTDVTGYIISNETFPMRQINRFGFLPLVVQHFLQVDNNQCVSENNAALIKPNTSCILRSSVEQKPNQSIMGCFADLYANSRELQQTPSVEEFKKIIRENVSLDKFIEYNNGNLVSVFKPPRIDLSKLDISKYEQSLFYQSIDLNDDYQMDFLEDTIAAYDNFMDYIMDDKSAIDHTYLWDMMVDDNPNLIMGGVNLVILELVENDITGNIRVLCPTNSRNKLYDQAKQTFILIKRDIYYEPLCVYKDVDGKIYKSVLFLETNKTLAPLQRIIRIIEKSMNKYCMPNPSLPKVYHFKHNISAPELYNALIQLNERVAYQVLNYQFKTIGLVIRDKHIYVPCEPSSPIPDMDKHIVDEDRDDMWNDYYTTTAELQRLASAKIPCMPKLKVVDDGLIVGIITETNQFVQIEPPIENVAVNDGLPIIYSSNYNSADKALRDSVDNERIKTITNISLESQFYSLFRTIVRDALNHYESRNEKQRIFKIIENMQMSHLQKIREISRIIHVLVDDKIAFNEFDEDVLLEFNDLACSKDTPSPYCIVKDDTSVLVIPKQHLISGKDNEIIYFGRIADELVRYRRIRLFMMNDKNYLNISNTEYKIHDDEFILIQTSINNDYLKNLVPMNISNYIKNTHFTNAQPQISQKYSTERIPLTEQTIIETNDTSTSVLDDAIISCIYEMVDVIGNQQSLWKRIFPKVAKEIKFKNTSTNCSFYPLIAIFKMRYNVLVSVMSLKISLWNAYEHYMEKYSKQILKLLKLQGKQSIVASIENKEMTLETAIMSPEYYISDLDVLMFAKHSKLQICLFNSNGLRSLNKKNIQWYICGQNYKEIHYFIRSPTLTGNNKVGEYHLIDHGYHLSELGAFQKIVQDSVIGFAPVLDESNLSSPESIETLESLLSRF